MSRLLSDTLHIAETPAFAESSAEIAKTARKIIFHFSLSLGLPTLLQRRDQSLSGEEGALQLARATKEGKTYKGIVAMRSVRLTCHIHGVDETEQLQQQCLSEVGDQVYEGGGIFGTSPTLCKGVWGKERILAQNASWGKMSQKLTVPGKGNDGFLLLAVHSEHTYIANGNPHPKTFTRDHI